MVVLYVSLNLSYIWSIFWHNLTEKFNFIFSKWLFSQYIYWISYTYPFDLKCHPYLIPNSHIYFLFSPDFLSWLYPFLSSPVPRATLPDCTFLLFYSWVRQVPLISLSFQTFFQGVLSVNCYLYNFKTSFTETLFLTSHSSFQSFSQLLFLCIEFFHYILFISLLAHRGAIYFCLFFLKAIVPCLFIQNWLFYTL